MQDREDIERWDHLERKKQQNLQDRLDKLENMVLSTGGFVKVYNMLNFAGKSLELKQIEDDLGAMIEQVLELKQELGCTSNLTLVKKDEHD